LASLAAQLGCAADFLFQKSQSAGVALLEAFFGGLRDLWVTAVLAGQFGNLGGEPLGLRVLDV
jgi:hypothetical protein